MEFVAVNEGNRYSDRKQKVTVGCNGNNASITRTLTVAEWCSSTDIHFTFHFQQLFDCDEMT